MKKKCATGAKVPAINDSWTAKQTKVLSQARTMCKGGKIKRGK